jgi:hypothetical protein
LQDRKSRTIPPFTSIIAHFAIRVLVAQKAAPDSSMSAVQIAR